MLLDAERPEVRADFRGQRLIVVILQEKRRGKKKPRHRFLMSEKAERHRSLPKRRKTAAKFSGHDARGIFSNRSLDALCNPETADLKSGIRSERRIGRRRSNPEGPEPVTHGLQMKSHHGEHRDESQDVEEMFRFIRFERALQLYGSVLVERLANSAGSAPCGRRMTGRPDSRRCGRRKLNTEFPG